MYQINKFSDNRLDKVCAYCGDFANTRDHTPSKILLEKPYPENLHVIPSCYECNNNFSIDEEYFACALECMIHGTADLRNLSRSRIVQILKRKINLKNKLDKAFSNKDNNLYFEIEKERFENVLNKFAYGHIKFENSDTPFSRPKNIWFKTFNSLSRNEYNYFFSTSELIIAPEVGSRATQYVCIDRGGVPINNWKLVQDSVYSYSVINNDDLKVRMLFYNYLVCEVLW
jgi:hypothetical protein